MISIKEQVDRNCVFLSTLSTKFKTKILQLSQEIQECKFALAMAKRDHEKNLNQLMAENEGILKTLNEAHAAKTALLSGQIEEKLKNLESDNVDLSVKLKRQQEDHFNEMEMKENLHLKDLEIQALKLRQVEQELEAMERKEKVYLKDLEVSTLKIRQVERELDKSQVELVNETKMREDLEACIVQKDADIEQLKSDLANQKRLLENLQLELSNFKDKENLMERNGNDISIASSPASKRSRVGSLQEESCPRTGPVRVVFTGYRDPSGPKSLKYLGSLVEALGGHVHIGDVFSENVQHSWMLLNPTCLDYSCSGTQRLYFS
jgi:chromosome segregation ATPase